MPSSLWNTDSTPLRITFGLGDDLALAAFGVASLFNASEKWLDDQLARVPAEGEVIEGVVIDRR